MVTSSQRCQTPCSALFLGYGYILLFVERKKGSLGKKQTTVDPKQIRDELRFLQSVVWSFSGISGVTDCISRVQIREKNAELHFLGGVSTT